MLQLRLRPGLVVQIGVIALCVVLLLLAFGDTGIGYSSDSFAYLSAADSLRVEGLLSEDFWLVHYPPLYSLILLLLDTNITFITLFQSALLIANLGMMGYQMSMLGVNDWLIVVALLAIGMSPVMILWHGHIHSEGLFVFFMQISIVLLAKKKLRWAAGVIGLASIQRYVGVTLIGLAFIVILIRHGWLRAILFSVIASLPMGIWLIRNELISDIPGRHAFFDLIPFEKVTDGIVVLAPWLYPTLGILLLSVFLTRTLPPFPLLARIIAGYIVGYLVFMLFSISFFDHFTSLDYRILAPVMILSWVLVAWLFQEQFRVLSGQRQQVVAGLAGLLIVAYLLVSVAYAVGNLRPRGIGLVRATRPAHEAVLESIPEGTTIYSNHNWLIQMLGRQASNLPFKTYWGRLEEMAVFDAQMNQVTNEVYNGDAVILWFEEFNKTNLVSLKELQAFLPYEVYDGLLVFSAQQ